LKTTTTTQVHHVYYNFPFTYKHDLDRKCNVSPHWKKLASYSSNLVYRQPDQKCIWSPQ